MTAGWIDAVALVEATDLLLFVSILERHTSGLDGTYRCDDRLLVQLDSDVDEVWFRIAALDETTIGEIHLVGRGVYLVPDSLLGDIDRWVNEGLFAGTTVPLTRVRLELRDSRTLHRLERALYAERASFGGGRPKLCLV